MMIKLRSMKQLMGLVILSFPWFLQSGNANDSLSRDLVPSRSMELFQDLKRTDDSPIHYYLELADVEKDSKMLLVLIQGSGCIPISGQSETMQEMAKVMPGADVLWVEKRGLEGIFNEEMISLENCPNRYYQYESLHQRVEDYKSVIGSLSDQYEKIVVLGGSEGATIVGLLLQDQLPIDAAIALNGGGQYFIDDVLWNIERTVPEPDRTFALAGIQSFAAHILAMTAKEVALDQDYSSNHSARWWQEMFSLDMTDVWGSGKIPLLMVQTLRDDNVSVLSAEAMFEKLELFPQIKVITMPALDHGFHDAKGQSKAQDVVREIQGWLKSTLK